MYKSLIQFYHRLAVQTLQYNKHDQLILWSMSTDKNEG